MRAEAGLHRGCAAYLAHALEQPHHYLLVFGDTGLDGLLRLALAALRPAG